MLSRTSFNHTFTIFFLCTIAASCNPKTTKQNAATQPKTSEENENVALDYKTITIDYDSINLKKEALDQQFINLNPEETINALQQVCKLQGITSIENDSLPFQDYMRISEYYENSIPLPVYQKMFPDEEIKFDKRRNTNPIVNKKERTITIEKGVKIREERKYKTLLSLIEKDEHIQMLLTKQGKYSPSIELMTFSKNDFKLIDQINLKGGIYDSYDIDYWHSKISADYKQIEITSVKNLAETDIRLDTSIAVYHIDTNGSITPMGN